MSTTHEQGELDIQLGQRVEGHPSREAGLDRLRRFIPRAGAAYAQARNFDLGPLDRSNVSALSPIIRHRLVLEEEVLRETLAVHSLEAAEKFVQEVIWRSYFKGWLEHHPRVWSNYERERDDLIARLAHDGALRADFENAVDGKTGLACFDAWAQELVETGYLHNHARMWFASIWIYTLRLPWALGADFFLRHLLDGDPASNTASWRWVCGLHTPGKTYLARASNIARFTRGRFRPEGKLATTAPPIDEPSIGPVEPLVSPPSLPSGEPFALLITEEDCHPESLDLPAAPCTILGVSDVGQWSPLGRGDRARAFARGAVEDALDRSKAFFAIRPALLESGRPELDLLARMRAQGLRTVVTAHAPVGPTADWLGRVGPGWNDAGLRLIEIRRPYDSLIWPHASRGFFPLKKKIPDFMRTLGFA
jgi:deoxyribodipyrimidine photo-lyase